MMATSRTDAGPAMENINLGLAAVGQQCPDYAIFAPPVPDGMELPASPDDMPDEPLESDTADADDMEG